jgi:hypothetical protein
MEWYGDPAALKAEEIIARCIDEEERALADGFSGLRITGNTSFVPRETWGGLMEFEKKFHQRIRNRRIVACCSYHAHQCQPVDVLEVASRHDAALERPDQHWHVYMHAPAHLSNNPRGRSPA